MCESEYRQDAAEAHFVCHPGVYLLFFHRATGARRPRLQGVGTVCRFHDKIQQKLQTQLRGRLAAIQSVPGSQVS